MQATQNNVYTINIWILRWLYRKIWRFIKHYLLWIRCRYSRSGYTIALFHDTVLHNSQYNNLISKVNFGIYLAYSKKINKDLNIWVLIPYFSAFSVLFSCYWTCTLLKYLADRIIPTTASRLDQSSGLVMITQFLLLPICTSTEVANFNPKWCPFVINVLCKQFSSSYWK